MTQDFIRERSKARSRLFDARRQVSRMERQRESRIVYLVLRDVPGHSRRDILRWAPSGMDQIGIRIFSSHLQHQELVGVAQGREFPRRAELVYESPVPERIDVIERPFRPRPDQRDRHLVSEEGVLVDPPVELIRVLIVDLALIDRLGADGVVTMLEDHLRHLPWRECENSSFGVPSGLQDWTYALLDDTVARRQKDALARADAANQPLVAAISQNEVSVEEQQVGIGHGGPEVLEAAEEGVGDRASVLPRLGHEVVQGNEPQRAHGLQPLRHRMSPRVLEEILFSDDHGATIVGPRQGWKVTRGQRCGQGKIEQPVYVLFPPRVRN